MSAEPQSASPPGTVLPVKAELALLLLRVGIGWHFLYEGLAKLLSPHWSAVSFLLDSTGPFAPVFRALAAYPAILQMVDQLNIWGLLLIGAGLMFGLLTRASALCGVVLLALYYLASPPWFQSPGMTFPEGHSLLINRNLVELFALLLVAVLPAARFGLDGWILQFWAGESAPARSASRRRFLAHLSGLPFAGLFSLAALRRHAWRSDEEKKLVDAYSGATLRMGEGQRLEDLKGTLPAARIGDLAISRMILGGNLLNGYAHARDLIYVSRLVKAYHHRGKIFQTLRLAEACGVNTILTSPILCPVIGDYWQATGGKIQFISDCDGDDLMEMIRRSVDAGACACYIQGGTADGMVLRRQFDQIARALELIRKNGIPAGIGAHKLATVQGCVEKGLKPDFWMKTLHKTDYWSAQPNPPYDNIWCTQPEETIAYMRERPEPWIAFKTLAAGAIQPEAGFRYAFEGGADFICVGMYDFQLVEDVNIGLSILNEPLERQRKWRA